MHALIITDRQRAIHHKTRGRIFVINDIIVHFLRGVDGRFARTVFMHLVVLAAIRVRAHGGEECVSVIRYQISFSNKRGRKGDKGERGK